MLCISNFDRCFDNARQDYRDDVEACGSFLRGVGRVVVGGATGCALGACYGSVFRGPGRQPAHLGAAPSVHSAPSPAAKCCASRMRRTISARSYEIAALPLTSASMSMSCAGSDTIPDRVRRVWQHPMTKIAITTRVLIAFISVSAWVGLILVRPHFRQIDATLYLVIMTIPLMGLAMVLAEARSKARRKRHSRVACVHCGHRFDPARGPHRCPECGEWPEQ